MRLKLLLVALILTTPAFAQRDPGPRGGSIGAGNPVAGLTADQLRFFQDALARFTTPDTVSTGLGPRYNSTDCQTCHSQPATGGSSPSVSAYPFVGPNPEIAASSANGATNVIPPFVTTDGPAREARFPYVLGTGGLDRYKGGAGRHGYGGDREVMNPENQPEVDGSVHDLFTVVGAAGAGGCTISQPDFAKAIREHDIIFRIPTPVFGVGLIETITDATILSNLAATAQARAAAGIGGVPNRSGNDGTITRFGWKAQNKSMMVFAAEAYNVEVGVTNEMFPNPRGDSGVADPAACNPMPQPEDSANFLPANSDTTQVMSNVGGFRNFMEFLDQPTPGPSSASTVRGAAVFTKIGCALCHTPSMTTGPSALAPAAMGNVVANLFSDLLLHHMGDNLADGISQGNAGPDQFRSAPLWGVGQRVFFLHDGRTSDLMDAIDEHASNGSEANQVIGKFNRLSQSDQQALLDFLRSL